MPRFARLTFPSIAMTASMLVCSSAVLSRRRVTGVTPMQGPQSTNGNADADRVLRVYADRSARGLSRRYANHRPENLLALHQIERVLFTELVAHGWTDFGRLDVLDVGCGSGGVLVRLIGLDVDPARAHGVDVLEDAIGLARSRLPTVDLRVGNGAELPYADDSMDLVLQFTMVSSILDAAVRAKVAREMSRVVRPGGLIVSYDFRINPLNPDARGLRRGELETLFPGHGIKARAVTLAPPIARLVASRSYGMAAALQALVPLRTHLLAFVTPPESGAR
jgi:ubiquinone/menaquinone biosynthesis C-methylase UbiE